MTTLEEEFLFTKRRRRVPHEFVLEALAEAQPRTHAMFGCLAVYVGEKIVLFLRDKKDLAAGKKAGKLYGSGKRAGRRVRTEAMGSKDNGVWLATTAEHHESLRREFPNLRSIASFGNKVTGWQVLPADAPDFEEAALRACQLVLAGDQRIGKVPK